MGKEYHPEHFVCVSCNESLNGGRFVLTADGRYPCCVPCYEANFTHDCRACGLRIGLDSKDMSYKDTHWHEACFACHKCRAPLEGKHFACTASKNDAAGGLVFCGDCYDAEFASRCDACGESFRPGMKKVSRQDQESFVPTTCNQQCKISGLFKGGSQS